MCVSIDTHSEAQYQAHDCPHNKWLAIGALRRREEPGLLAGDPRSGVSRLLYAKSLHRPGKYNMLFKKKNSLYNHFKQLLGNFHQLLVTKHLKR